MATSISRVLTTNVQLPKDISEAERNKIVTAELTRATSAAEESGFEFTLHIGWDQAAAAVSPV
ncbi:hypothetical protein P0W64_00595 [Tsukamurella sp. 8F]|uniref:hypothetical protein n=1 Tax=unclassified Tsukamurella TaxID=2633480 RepID=UPI0023B8AE98|nr:MULTISPECIES: hypothetical protein [unclassified Tsukamurella]MDF0531422.1 hypothetical protein [Tsukamurella sp. 8J]MDF0585272.1 hypothetical protein [Tsukamurella sp. 8F]